MLVLILSVHPRREPAWLHDVLQGDRRNDIADGHYTDENDEKIVQAILDLIRKLDASRSPDRSPQGRNDRGD